MKAEADEASARRPTSVRPAVAALVPVVPLARVPPSAVAAVRLRRRFVAFPVVLAPVAGSPLLVSGFLAGAVLPGSARAALLSLLRGALGQLGPVSPASSSRGASMIVPARSAAVSSCAVSWVRSSLSSVLRRPRAATVVVPVQGLVASGGPLGPVRVLPPGLPASFFLRASANGSRALFPSSPSPSSVSGALVRFVPAASLVAAAVAPALSLLRVFRRRVPARAPPVPVSALGRSSFPAPHDPVFSVRVLAALGQVVVLCGGVPSVVLGSVSSPPLTGVLSVVVRCSLPVFGPALPPPVSSSASRTVSAFLPVPVFSSGWVPLRSLAPVSAALSALLAASFPPSPPPISAADVAAAVRTAVSAAAASTAVSAAAASAAADAREADLLARVASLEGEVGKWKRAAARHHAKMERTGKEKVLLEERLAAAEQRQLSPCEDCPVLSRQLKLARISGAASRESAKVEVLLLQEQLEDLRRFRSRVPVPAPRPCSNCPRLEAQLQEQQQVSPLFIP